MEVLPCGYSTMLHFHLEDVVLFLAETVNNFLSTSLKFIFPDTFKKKVASSLFNYGSETDLEI